MTSVFPHKISINESVAVVAREVAREMIERLKWMTIAPKVIVEINVEENFARGLLAAQYPEAEIISISNDVDVLATIPNIDLIFANLQFAWQNNYNEWLQKLSWLLSENGLLILSTFGLDTLKEIEPQCIIPYRLDMHNLGDLLLTCQLSDPVLDTDYFTLSYRDAKKMEIELSQTGMIDLNKFLTHNSNLMNTYEIVYAHAWKNAPDQNTAEVKVPLSMLKNSLKRFS